MSSTKETRCGSNRFIEGVLDGTAFCFLRRPHKDPWHYALVRRSNGAGDGVVRWPVDRR